MHRLPPRTRYFYDYFVEFANEADPFHAYDLERFYQFIWAAHRGGTKFGENDLRTLLIQDDFEVDAAEELADIYGHGRALLKERMPYVPRSEWDEQSSARA